MDLFINSADRHPLSWLVCSTLLTDKSTVASPSFHLTATNQSSSQSTVLSTDTEQSVAFMVYFQEHKAITFPKSSSENWEGKGSPYGCAPKLNTFPEWHKCFCIHHSYVIKENCEAAMIAVAIISNWWQHYWKVIESLIIELSSHWNIQ